MKYVIVRTDRAGVHAGYMQSREGREITLTQARRLWYWKGAFTLNEIAINGVKFPDNCKFSCECIKILLLDAIEIIDVTSVGMASIVGVKNYDPKQ